MLLDLKLADISAAQWITVQREPEGASVVCSPRAKGGGQETARPKDKRGEE
jgi:hypothetical protein